MKPETERFYNFIRKRAKLYSLFLQGHAEGRETTIQEEAALEDEFVDFELRHDPEE